MMTDGAYQDIDDGTNDQHLSANKTNYINIKQMESKLLRMALYDKLDEFHKTRLMCNE